MTLRLLAWKDQRGVALPLALLALLILSALVLGFSALSATEPTIANNHLLAAQSRALAEAGVERALWALNNPDRPGGLPISQPPLPTWVSTAPYDGRQLVPVATAGTGVGGFRVTVTKGPSSAELIITSVGWVPSDAAPRAARRGVEVRVFNPRLLFKNPPAAVSVRGALRVGGHARVDARADGSCGAKAGTLTAGATSVESSAALIWGADGNDAPGQRADAQQGGTPANPADLIEQVAPSAFDSHALTDADIGALRTHARTHGTYLRGAVAFGPDNRMPNGLIFVDTISGMPISREGVTPATPASDLARVSIGDQAPADGSGTWSGYLFVNGTLSISGASTMRGMLYAQGGFSYQGGGSGGIQGAVISRSIRDLSSSSLDADLPGPAAITFDCGAARTGGGTLRDTWSMQAGSYRELGDT